MPHKKAKRSVREEQQKQRGSNLAPTHSPIINEEIPKSAARVLNALKVREEYRNKRKSEQEGIDARKGEKRRKLDGSSLKIKPGESIQHFYRRVEDDMRPLVRSAVQTSKAVERKARNAELEAGRKGVESRDSKLRRPPKSSGHPALRSKSPPVPSSGIKSMGPKEDKNANRPKEFETFSTSTPRRLNDIAQAPPEIKNIPRGATAGGKREGVLSMAQKTMMEEEREKAIARYRVLKASRSKTMEGKGRKDPLPSEVG